MAEEVGGAARAGETQARGVGVGDDLRRLTMPPQHGEGRVSLSVRGCFTHSMQGRRFVRRRCASAR
jgi:hypothetical protein